MSFKNLINKYLSEDQRKSLDKLSSDAKETVENVGHKLFLEAEKTSKSFEEWIQTDGKELYREFRLKMEDLKNDSQDYSDVDLEKEAEKIFDNIYGDEKESNQDLEKDLENDIEDADKTIEDIENYTSEKSHVDALKSSGNIPDDFMSKAGKFADGSLSVQSEESDDTDKNDTTIDKSSDKQGSTHGFTDHDKDGNDIIDDAIIDED